MDRMKIIDLISWLRVLVFTGALYVLFKSAVFAQVSDNYILYYLRPILTLFGAFLLATLVPNTLFKFCSALWNKVTPLKDKPTFIETEIVYLLSVVPATSLFLCVSLDAPLDSALSLTGLVFAAALPAVIIPYLACRVFLKSAAEIAKMEAKQAKAEIEADVAERLDPDALESPDNMLMPFLLSALIFAASVSLLGTLAVFMRGGGFQPKIFTSFMGTSTIAVILLTLFGHSALNFGASIQTRLGVRPFTSSRGIACAWVLGIMVSMTCFILLFSGLRLPTSLESLTASWSFIAAYLIILLGCLLSGVVLSLFYKKKPLSAVFA